MSFIASKNLHNTLTERIFRAPMKFIDETPLGRIVSRFSQDFGRLDSAIPTAARQIVYYGGSTIGIMILIATLQPVGVCSILGMCGNLDCKVQAFLLVSFALFILVILLHQFFGGACRDLRRLGK